VYDNLLVTQSSLNVWNRTLIRSGTTDVIQNSFDGINWNDIYTGPNTSANAPLKTFTKPAFNGVYWLVGCPKGSIATNKSVLYSPNGINYYALENNQFTYGAINCTWNGQYWLAGDFSNAATGASIRRSLDGINWTSVGGFDKVVTNFAWNGILWVATGSNSANSNMIYSYDGFTWANCTGDLPTNPTCVQYNGSYWLAGGSNATAATNYLSISSDGINWTNTAPLANPGTKMMSVYDIKWNGLMWVTVGSFNGSNNSIAYSSNGSNFQYASGYDFSNIGYNVEWNGQLWVANGLPATPSFILMGGGYGTSAPESTAGVGQGQQGVYYNQNFGYTGGVKPFLAYSLNNGNSWINCTFTRTNTNNVDGPIQAINFNSYTNTFIASSCNTIYYSTDGITWDLSKGNGGNVNSIDVFTQPASLNMIAFNSKYTFLTQLNVRCYASYSSCNYYAYSDHPVGGDGPGTFICWTGTYWIMTSYGSGTLFNTNAVGPLGGPNGLIPGMPSLIVNIDYIWNNSTTGPANVVCGCMANNLIVFGLNASAGSSNIKIYTINNSALPSTWTNTLACAGTNTPQNPPWSIQYNGNYWLAGCSNGIYKSSDSTATGTWTLVDSTADKFRSITWTGTVWIAVGVNNIRISANGTSWNNISAMPSPPTGTFYQRAVYASPPTFYSEAYSYDGINWIRGPPKSLIQEAGCQLGFSSNVLPAIETTTLKVYTNNNGYIPIYQTSTNSWLITQSSIIMNNSLVINKNDFTDKRVGINTMYPKCTLDVNGDIQVNQSTFTSTLVVGYISSFSTLQNPNYPAKFGTMLFGSTYMTSLNVNTLPTAGPRYGPLDIYAGCNNPIIFRNSVAISSIFASTMVRKAGGQVSLSPAVGGLNGTAQGIYWYWNNGPSVSSSVYFVAAGTSMFTGQHAVVIDGVNRENVSSFAGLIVKSADRGYLSYDLNGNAITGQSAIGSTESLPYSVLTSNDNEAGVFGVISDFWNVNATINFSTLTNAYDNGGYTDFLYNRILVNGLGDGAIWVTNANGNISIGDYICSSLIPGHGRKQDDNGMYSYTVAKASMACDFDLQTDEYRCEEITWNQSTFIRAFVGCTYHCS
jgi:hypothetical protein